MTYLEIFIEENLATYKTGYINRHSHRHRRKIPNILYKIISNSNAIFDNTFRNSEPGKNRDNF